MIVSAVYIGTIYEIFRRNTWIYVLTDYELGTTYWQNFRASYINENILLFVVGSIIWLKAFY
jgi:hypothetical protein